MSYDTTKAEVEAAENVRTNEEKRVAAYNSGTKCTQPEEVTPETPLAELNLNWAEKDLPERIRTKHVHRLHPYLGKFIPQIVEIFLRKYYKTGDTVLDPFSGSGTTLVQANELGIRSIGFDISAFNVMLAKVKTGKYNLTKVRKEITDILDKTEAYSKPSVSPTLFDIVIPKGIEASTEDQYLNTWFAPNALKELLIFKSLIKNYEYQDLLKVILSRSARSSRLTTHFDLDFPKKPQTEPYECFKHGRTCQPTTDALKFLIRYGFDTIKRIEEYSKVKTNATVKVYNADSRFAKCEKVNGVITSPPYVGLIDYHEQHRYAYKLLELEDQSDSEIGAAKNGSSKKAKEQYKEDMAAVLRNSGSHVIKGGKLVVIAGDRDNLYPEIGEMAGLVLEDTVLRHVNRRTGRRSNEFFESVFIFSNK